MFLLIVCVFLVVVYGVYRIGALHKEVVAAVGFLRAELKEIHSLTKRKEDTPLGYHWFDEGWPVYKVDEEDRAPIDNPAPHRCADEYAAQMWISEYLSLPGPRDRRDFLRKLLRSGAWLKNEFLDIIYADPSPYVRAWAAAHLKTVDKDYPDPKNPVEIRNYEPGLLCDPAPFVRAALWSNPRCNRLPWSAISLSENWKEHFRGLSHLERLGMMRNPELSKRYVVALMETPSEELNIMRMAHAEVLRAAALNPELIGSSRLHGRKAWSVRGDWNEPFEEFGRMWELSVSKWMDQRSVSYFFLKFIQTKPDIKTAAYKSLLDKGEEANVLREAVIESCDPITDREVLNLAWADPSDACFKATKERVGRFTGLLAQEGRPVARPTPEG